MKERAAGRLALSLFVLYSACFHSAARLPWRSQLNDKSAKSQLRIVPCFALPQSSLNYFRYMVLRPAAFTIRITTRSSVIIRWYCFLRFWNVSLAAAAFSETDFFPDAGTDSGSTAGPG